MKLHTQSSNLEENTSLDHAFTHHAKKRMRQRGITREAISNTLGYGRLLYQNSCQIYFLGKKEVTENSSLNVDLEQYAGTHVLCSKDRVVITCYRNQNAPVRKNLKKGRYSQWR